MNHNPDIPNKLYQQAARETLQALLGQGVHTSTNTIDALEKLVHFWEDEASEHEKFTFAALVMAWHRDQEGGTRKE